MEQIWWERVPNALSFTTDIVENLLSEKSILLHCSGDFPWYTYMIRVIKESVKQQSSSKSFENIPATDDPGKYLLQEFCKSGKRAEYRPTKTYAKFFSENDDIVIHSRYFWVKISNKSQLESWTKFVSDYVKERGKGKDCAIFILEWIGNASIQAKKGIKLISMDKYVNAYDRIVFCTLAASSVSERSFIKNYLTELVANVIGNDIELCAACLDNYREFLRNTFATINEVVHSRVRSDGSDFVFLKSEDEINHLIWLAQIKSVYPVLEEFRENFIQRHHASIKKHLPIKSSYEQFYNEEGEVELGTLKYMADNYLLSLSSKETEQLTLHKDARNKLSHLTPLTLDEIKQLDV